MERPPRWRCQLAVVSQRSVGNYGFAPIPAIYASKIDGLKADLALLQRDVFIGWKTGRLLFDERRTRRLKKAGLAAYKPYAFDQGHASIDHARGANPRVIWMTMRGERPVVGIALPRQ